MTEKPTLLFTPGPTPVPPEVQAEISRPMIHHRSSEFQEIFASLRKNIHRLSDTDGESVVLTASGTAAMEATIASFFSAGEHVIIVDAGKFGGRWVELAVRYGLDVTTIVKPWGQAVTVEEIVSKIRPDTRAVLVQACESSTGVYHPVEAIGKALAAHPQLLFVVDAITAFGIYPLSQRGHHIDVLIGSSQKALMCPPGLSFVCISKRALSKIRPTTGMYLSLENELKSQVRSQSAFTPAVSLVRGMRKATEMILHEGIQKVFERHCRLQVLTRGFFRALGSRLLTTDEDASKGITAVHAFPGLDTEKWLKQLRDENGLWLASGQGDLKNKIFRMAHLGYCHEKSLKEALTLIARSLKNTPPTQQATDFLQKFGTRRDTE